MSRLGWGGRADHRDLHARHRRHEGRPKGYLGLAEADIADDQPVHRFARRQIAQRTERKLLKDVSVFDVYQGDKLPAGKKSYALSFTLQDEEKTLTDKAIDAIMQKLIYNFGKEAGAEIRK